MTTIAISQVSRKDRIIYWISTGIIFLFEGVGSIFFNSPLAIEGFRTLGFPDYFRYELAIGKMIGAVLLVLPFVSARLKEWAYVGFGLSCISAFIAYLSVGIGAYAFQPLIFLGIVVVSYVYFHKTKARKD